MRRNPALDGVRGIAILLVFAYHLAPDTVGGGFIGVDLFFVLSGFLITRGLVREHERTGGISLGRFYLRRARRLLPALWIALAVVATLVFVTAPGEVTQMKALLLASAFNYANVAVAEHGNLWAVFGWSLSAEEQFYLLWPPLLVVLIGRVRPRVLITVLGALAVGSAAARLGYWQHNDWSRAYYHPFAHADGLLIGCLLALTALPRLRGAILLLLLVALTATPRTPWMYPGGYALVIVACAGLVQAAANGELAWARNAVLRFFGRISYALYIWSGLLLGYFTGPWRLGGAALCTTLAVASYHLIERPLLEAGPIERWRRLRRHNDVVIEGRARSSGEPAHAAVAADA